MDCKSCTESVKFLADTTGLEVGSKYNGGRIVAVNGENNSFVVCWKNRPCVFGPLVGNPDNKDGLPKSGNLGTERVG